MGRNGFPHTPKTKIPRTTYETPDMVNHTCPKTGHVVPVAADHSPNGTYTLFDAKGKVLHKGNISELIADAGTAEAQADSEAP